MGILIDAMKNRKSVRTFSNKKLDESIIDKIKKYIKDVDNPFGIKIDIRFLNAKENGLISPVISGEEYYLAQKVERQDNYDLASGYSFEKVCIYAKTLGLGTVMLASTMNRSTFEKVIDVKDNEVMFVVSPIGYESNKRTMVESLLRKSINADTRLPYEKIFFDKNFDNGIKSLDGNTLKDLLEVIQKAPSAKNCQPWRIVIDDNKIHFYEYQTIKTRPIGDIQRFDMGIALAHFDMARSECNIEGIYSFENPNIENNMDLQYVITFNLK
ncbi:MAG: nitroreductase [Clostridia bacterium]|nr:nitroreductase [Clostridia bacterium]